MSLFNFNNRLSELSIQKKLLVINLTVITVVLLFAAIMAVVGEYFSKRDFIMESLQVQAKMLGNNSAAAIVFNDKKGATDILNALTESSDVLAAAIYDANGNVHASYLKKDRDVSMGDIELQYVHDTINNAASHSHDVGGFLYDKIHIVQDVEFDNEIIGRLFIQADISSLHDDIANYFLYTASVALFGLAMASLLLLKLRKSIMRPLHHLSELMDTVIQKNDYSVRIKKYSNDEIGKLSQGFNEMLAHIQVNDEKLAYELSERYKAEKYLDKLAYYDVTTDLPNRHFFQEHLDRAVEHAITTGQKMALMFLDLDNFKIVNDTAGHKTGDLLLKQASSRLSNVLRQHDYICRIGGDEFAIIIENIKDIGDVSIVTEKCIESLTNPFVFDEHKFYVGVSIGVSVCPDDTITANELLVNADVAMYEAKVNGKNNYKFFNKEMNEVNSLKYQLENDLRHAVNKNQMELYYQPQVDSQTGLLIGVEALMRWNHPEKGLVPPDRFIPIAEDTGLILGLGDWLFAAACRHGKQMVSAGLNDIAIAINISGVQIRESDFINKVDNALKKSGLNPANLEIELTESILMDDSELVIEKVKQLDKLGVRVSIDDFGTGFSSMNYLKSFPVSKLKIDKSFVEGLPQSSEDTAITKAIVAMSHGMGIKVVAEGVEHEDQVAFLREHQCDLFQGYYFSKPVPFNDFMKLKDQVYDTGKKLRSIK